MLASAQLRRQHNQPTRETHLNLRDLTDESLLIQTENLVRQEHEMLAKILHHLKEIDRRKLFSSLGFSSIYDYATKRLNYSEDQAYRRITAMRLLRDIPEIEAEISAGTLTLTNIGLAQTFFRQRQKTCGQPLDLATKRQILESLATKSTREAEKHLLALDPSHVPEPRERVRTLPGDRYEISLIVSGETFEKVGRLKGRLAHSSPNLSISELFARLCDTGLEEYVPVPATVSRGSANPFSSAAPRAAPRRMSQAEIHRQVWRRDNAACISCGSTYALEFDHIQPIAKGGDSAVTNLRLLCRSCNQRAAIEQFGLDTIEKHKKTGH